MDTLNQIVKANEQYAASFVPLKWGEGFKNLIVVTCMDPRIDPYNQLGLKYGEAITIRNGGGSAKNALPNIMVAQHFVGVRGPIAIFHHKDCGMTHVTTSGMHDLVKKANPGREDIAKAVEEMDFHHITDLEESLRSDVQFLKDSPMILPGTEISGWIYDVETGKITEIVKAVS